MTPPRITLENLLTSPMGFGLTEATPVQRAICRTSDGLPLEELWEDEEVKTAFGGAEPPSGEPPRKLVVLSAIRCGKSLFAAAKGVQISQTIDLDLSTVSVGDLVTFPILSLDKPRARAVFNHAMLNIQAMDARLGRQGKQKLLISDPTAETIQLRHPSGRPIEMTITAMARAGGSVVSTWLAGAVFDEAARMIGSEDGKVSLDESLDAIEGRVLPGGQILLISSPHAPFGPVYNLVTEHFGKPTRDIVVIRATGPAMNPSYWTPERCAELKARNPRAHRTDVLAQFADPEESLFSSIELEAATREGPLELPPEPGVRYVATMDSATRGNAWTLIVLGCHGLGGPGGLQPLYKVALARQWQGSKSAPLKPDAVLSEISSIVRPYGVDQILADQHMIDALADLAERHGISVLCHPFTSENRLKMVETLRHEVQNGCFELPPDPAVRGDLVQTKKRVTVNGVTLVLPRSGGGRHCDYVPSLALTLVFPPELPEAEQPQRDEDLERALARVRSSQDPERYWENLIGRLT